VRRQARVCLECLARAEALGESSKVCRPRSKGVMPGWKHPRHELWIGHAHFGIHRERCAFPNELGARRRLARSRDRRILTVDRVWASLGRVVLGACASQEAARRDKQDLKSVPMPGRAAVRLQSNEPVQAFLAILDGANLYPPREASQPWSSARELRRPAGARPTSSR